MIDRRRHAGVKAGGGDKLALTPPMCWNDWYIHGRFQDAFTEKVGQYGVSFVRIRKAK